MRTSAHLHPRAAELISLLELQPHPEGGYYRRVFQSAVEVQPTDNRDVRMALTSIYFLLPGDDVSRWHRVASDEVWHFYEGDPLELFCANSDFSRVDSLLLGPVAEKRRPVRVIPAGQWQAARSTGSYTLVGCSVGPGFVFTDFQLLNDLEAASEQLRRTRPELAHFL